MSLKNTIKYYLQKHKYLSLQNLEALCKQEQKKLSNAERRLRELMRTEPIVPIKNRAGAIIAYELVQNENPFSGQAIQPGNPNPRQNALPVQLPMFTRNARITD